MISKYNDAVYGPMAPDVVKFYADVLLSAKVHDPAATLDWENGLTTPEVVYNGQRLLITNQMRVDALAANRTAGDMFNRLAISLVKIPWQQEILGALEGAGKMVVSEATIQKLLATWLPGSVDSPVIYGSSSVLPSVPRAVPVPLTPNVVLPPVPNASVLKPVGWDSTYVLVNTPSGQVWQKP